MAKSGGGSDYDYIFKLVLIGDSGVGKSNLLLRFTRDEFHLSTRTTIGVEFAYRQLVIEGKKIRNQIWDTAGQDRFKAVIPQLYRGSDGIFVVFDLTKPDTFNHIPTWIEEIHRHTTPDIPIILIGNKSDLKREVLTGQAIALAQKFNISYMETSALNASNVEKAFTTFVTDIYHKKKMKSVDDSRPIDPVVGSTQRRTIPIVSDDPIVDNPNSFRIKSDEELSFSKKSSCC